MERCAQSSAKNVRSTLIKKYVLEFIHVQDCVITRSSKPKVRIRFADHIANWPSCVQWLHFYSLKCDKTLNAIPTWLRFCVRGHRKSTIVDIAWLTIWKGREKSEKLVESY